MVFKYHKQDCYSIDIKFILLLLILPFFFFFFFFELRHNKYDNEKLHKKKRSIGKQRGKTEAISIQIFAIKQNIVHFILFSAFHLLS